MDGLKWYRVKATWDKWTTGDNILTIAIVIAFVLMFLTALFIGKADAHDTHLSDMVGKFCPVVASGQVDSVGTVIATDCSGDGSPDHFWRIWKHGDLSHVALHIEALTPSTGVRLLILHQLRN